MSKNSTARFVRTFAATLKARLREPRHFLQVVAGPRQVGKSTLVLQVLGAVGTPSAYVSADEPTLRDRVWITQRWEEARTEARRAGESGSILALDEIQKVPGWSETVKRLWDEDTVSGLPLRVVILGSAPLLLRRGLSESLAGRFEVVRLPHWTLSEMRAAFGFTLEQYLHFGGYPGAAPLVGDPERWARYILDSLVETTISRDVLLLSRVDKPALLRRVFELGCRYSGQVLSYTKMLGQLQDAGNTTTLAHYLELLAGAGLLTGIPKFAGQVVRQRGSSPKLQVLNTALLTVQAGLSMDEALADPAFRGRLVESAIGAHLANAAAIGTCELFYWRELNREVDFVVRVGRQVTAIEVKSGRVRDSQPGMAAFTAAFKPQRALLVGGAGMSVEEFLSQPVEVWAKG
jgi:hypothetical protein